MYGSVLGKHQWVLGIHGRKKTGVCVIVIACPLRMWLFYKHEARGRAYIYMYVRPNHGIIKIGGWVLTWRWALTRDTVVVPITRSLGCAIAHAACHCNAVESMGWGWF